VLGAVSCTLFAFAQGPFITGKQYTKVSGHWRHLRLDLELATCHILYIWSLGGVIATFMKIGHKLTVNCTHGYIICFITPLFCVSPVLLYDTIRNLFTFETNIQFCLPTVYISYYQIRITQTIFSNKCYDARQKSWYNWVEPKQKKAIKQIRSIEWLPKLKEVHLTDFQFIEAHP
jgi:hypothetical protein